MKFTSTVLAVASLASAALAQNMTMGNSSDYLSGVAAALEVCSLSCCEDEAGKVWRTLLTDDVDCPSLCVCVCLRSNESSLVFTVCQPHHSRDRPRRLPRPRCRPPAGQLHCELVISSPILSSSHPPLPSLNAHAAVGVGGAGMARKSGSLSSCLSQLTHRAPVSVSTVHVKGLHRPCVPHHRHRRPATAVRSCCLFKAIPASFLYHFFLGGPSSPPLDAPLRRTAS